ncbi:TniB family NTP-binding protein [Salinimonas iocasae]|uniref:TniB family NTP-binding protein n=1 Tax=Salinimonas iocasae TaxID=2572577 RepID=UPI00143DA86D|nr:TniB family NTP-binding protein [Salinimonas iocasae]
MNFNIIERHRSGPRRQYIDMSFTQRALDNLLHALASATTPSPNGAIITGSTGVGKSSLISLFAKQANNYLNNDLAVVIVQSKNILGEKTFHSAVLEVLGDLTPTRGTYDSMDVRLTALIKGLGVQMIIFDDYHHLVNQRGDESIHKITESLKSLSNKNKVSIGFVGLPEVITVLDINKQIDTRFPHRYFIPPQSIVSETAKKDFRNFLDGYICSQKLSLGFDATSDDNLLHFYCATEGILRNVENLITKTKMDVWGEGRETLEMQDFALTVLSIMPLHLLVRNTRKSSKNKKFSSIADDAQVRALSIIPFFNSATEVKKWLGTR